ncbi:MAG TPA: hypothetical protein VFE46_14775 [Pirellulales bacterium]|jgi:hypothetical protein|nr:hypothetical protein [Pirellulales bacterium]
MIRSVRFRFAPLVLVLALGVLHRASLATAASNDAAAALTLLPDDTLAAVVIPQLNVLDAKISGLGGALQMPIPSPMMLGRGMIGLKDGLKEDGPLVVAAIGPSTEEHDFGTFVGLVAITDYQKLIGQFSPQDQGGGISQLTLPHVPKLLIAKVNDNFAVFAHAGDESRKQLERIVAAAAAPTAGSAATLNGWAAQQDVGLVITNSGVKVLLDRAGSALKAFEDKQAPESTRQAQSLLSQLIPIAQREVSQMGVGLRIDDDHTLHLVNRLQLASGGELSKAASQVPSPPSQSLAGLPTGTYLMALDGSMGSTMRNCITTLSLKALRGSTADQGGTKISDDDWNKLAEQFKHSLRGLKSMSFVMGVPPSGKSMYSRMYAVVHAENAQTYLQDYESSMTIYGNMLKSLNNPALPSYEISKSEMDGAPVLEVTADMTGVFNSMQQNGAPRAMGMTQILMGNDNKATTYMAMADATTVVMAWGDSENLKTVLQAVKSPETSLSSDVDVKTTVALMPKDAQWRAFINPSGYLEFTKNIMQMTMPQFPLQLPPFPNTPDIGVSAQLGAQNIDTEILVPAAVLQGIGAYTQQLQHHGP